MRAFLYRVFYTALLSAVAGSLWTVCAAERQTLPTSFAAPPHAVVLEPLSATRQIGLSVVLPLRNMDQLRKLLDELQDPSSPRFGKYLSVEEFTRQFGPSESDYAKVLAWLKSRGMTVTRTHSNRTLINVSAPVSVINETFSVRMTAYRHPTENRKFFAPNVEPTFESGLPILNIQGFSDYNLPRPMLRKADPTAHSDQTGSGPGGQFLGSDMRAAYAPVALDGTGQAVGLVELGPYNFSDVQAYFTSLGQPLNVPIYNVLLGVDGICSGTPATNGCDDGEEVIDMQQAISMAPHLSALIIYETNGPNTDALTAFTQAAEDNIARQISLSFGWGGTPATSPGYEQIFLELQAQGQNVFVASGDGGATVGDVGYPGDSPNIVDVGGTDLTTAGPGGAWASESGWAGSGGGWDTGSSIPSYQTPVINSSNQGSRSFRNLPDVAMEANTDNYVCVNGTCGGGIGGTSLSAPRWAGYLALANQQANGRPIGFLNKLVYSTGQASDYTNVFHDITTGNNFNSSSPNLFTAVPGYDLVTGWGTPNGQALLDVLGPAQTGSPNFALSASPSKVDLKPGGSGQTVISVNPSNGFAAPVNLTVTVIGAPEGVSASLEQSSVTGGGSTALKITTTSAAPGGDFLIAVRGTGEGVSQTAYITLALPTFGLALAPTMLYLNQNDDTTATVTVAPENGFSGRVEVSLAGSLPAGVMGAILRGKTPDTRRLALVARANALTGTSNPISITAQSGDLSQSFSSAVLAVSAAVGKGGGGTPVNLSSAYNTNAIYDDGVKFSSQGGLGGYAYSSKLLTPARVLNGIQFNFGKADIADAVAGSGQIIQLPAGNFTTLQLLATGINGEQASQPLTVTYTDGTTARFTQGFSDWYSPSNNLDEAEAVAMPYRNVQDGTKDTRPFNLYAYAFLLDSTRQVKSFTLPNNSNVIVLAATLASPDLGTPVNLAAVFNATGIYTDGSTFSGSEGLDGGGAAYSANLLGDSAGRTSVLINGVQFNWASANQPNVVYGTGNNIAMPSGHYSQVRLLGTGVQGAQTEQSITVTYTDGSKQTITQSFSDWFSPGMFPHESEVFAMPYRDLNDGTQDDRTFNLYQYILPLDAQKSVQSIALPNNRDVVVLAITLVN